MKKALSTVLIFIAVMQIGGIMPFYFYFMQVVKDHVKVELGTQANLEKIFVAEADYHNPAIFNYTGEHEFEMNGQLYDYKTVESQSGNYIFYALPDRTESMLARVICNEFQQRSDKNKAKAPAGKVLKDALKDLAINTFCIKMATPVVSVFNHERIHTGLLEGHENAVQNPPCLT